jgi:hypothetical protein
MAVAYPRKVPSSEGKWWLPQQPHSLPEGTFSMRFCHSLDRREVTFDDDHLVANAGLMLPATLAQHLGLLDLFDEHVDLGEAKGRANVGHKAMTLIHSALAGGDSIDDADALRAGATQAVLGHVVLAPSTLGTFLRSFSWGHARQLDVVAGDLLTRAWAAGAGPGEESFTIDVDSSIHETYGLAKEGGTHFTYNHVRGYNPLYAVAAGTGDVLHVRLRGSNAHSGRGAASFLTETFGRVRTAGAAGPIVLRADSGFYSRTVVEACRRANVTFSITAKQHKGGVKTAIAAIAAIDESAWVAIPYFLDGADVAETTYQPFGVSGQPCRLIVRRVRPTPGSQLALFVEFTYHAFVTNRQGEMVELEADHRRHAEIENTIRDLKLRCRSQPSAVGTLRCERGVVGLQRHGPQSGPLLHQARTRRLPHQDRDPSPPLPDSPWTHHPLGPSAHDSPPDALAVGAAVRKCPSTAPCHRACDLSPSVPTWPGLICCRGQNFSRGDL